ncbi:unnamed protein product [Larinioides sclopetarius]|uniref:Uncharacterized protein n=1 Tax=Larinioides sclopetarius TaxID=280406 RepID=A0AAV2C1Q3_9ARAC
MAAELTTVPRGLPDPFSSPTTFMNPLRCSEMGERPRWPPSDEGPAADMAAQTTSHFLTRCSSRGAATTGPAIDTAA